MTANEILVTDRTRLRRARERGTFDRATVYEILDDGFVCHLGLAHEGRAWAMPMVYGRSGDSLFVHGAAANWTLSTAGAGADVCLTVTHVDGLVLSRSVFHHSVNYRSVMVFGQPVTVDDADEKQRGFDAIMDHVHPGRGADVRALSESEIRRTQLLRLDIDEASAKVRTGPPVEEPEDLALPVWGGEIPLRVVAAAPIPDEHVHDGVAVPRWRG
jgi:nitroimidazol reductase NimA-like FMN-containing flavoprotein (pyridoxamine 5'-phosphate oxidase superfamily)